MIGLEAYSGSVVAPSKSVCTSVISGVGLGLRSPHINEILETLPDVPWFEILADNYLAASGAMSHQLLAVRESYPLTFHCVGLSLGSTEPLDYQYLHALRRLIQEVEPAWVSDHLSFSHHAGRQFHDLLPVPYNEESLNHLTGRIQQTQDFLGERILVENASSYFCYQASDMDEADFIAELVCRADCDLLLDINNVYVNAVNHEFDAVKYLQKIPRQRVREIHLAGYEEREGYLLDAHNQAVTAPVWQLYADFIQTCPQTPTLIEWDKDIPSFEVLRAEARHAEGLRAYQVSAA